MTRSGKKAQSASAQTASRKRQLPLLLTYIRGRLAQSWAFLVFFGCALYNIYGSTIGWGQPILGDCSMRQTQTAINVYYMLRGSSLLFYETPVFGPPWASPIEFPIFQWIVAAIVGVFGTPLDQTGRFVSLICFWLALLVAYRLLRFLGLSRDHRLVVISILLVSPYYIFWSRSFMRETAVVLLGLLYLAFVFLHEERRQARWLVLASAFGILAALAKATTFATFLAAVWLVVAWFRFSDWKKRYWAPTLVTLAAATLPAILAVAWWAHATDLVKADNPLGMPYGQNYSTHFFSHWVLGAAAPASVVGRRLTLDTWLVIFGRVVQSEYPIWLLLGCGTCLIVAWRRRIAFGACLLLYLTGPLAFTNLYFVHSYYSIANLIFLITALGLCVVALLERTGWRRWLGVAALTAMIGVSVYRHQTVYAPAQRSSDVARIAAAKAVERITEPNDVMLGCGLDWGPEIPYYAHRRALMFPNWATDEAMARAFHALDNYRIGAAVVFSPATWWEGDYSKHFRDALGENLQRHGLSRFPSYSVGGLLHVFPAARYEAACRALAHGKQCREKGQTAEAISALDDAVAGLPGEPEPYFYRALCRLARGQLDSGLQDCETSLRLSSVVDPCVYIPCARAYLAAGRSAAGTPSTRAAWLERSLSILNTLTSPVDVLEIDPLRLEAHELRSAVYAAMGRTADAKGFDADAYCRRGIDCAQKGELDEAIADYSEAIGLNPKYAEAYNNRGFAYVGKGNFDQAIADLNEAIRLKPKYAKAYNNRGTAYAQEGEFDQAIADFTEAIRLNPEIALAYSNRGLAYKQKGQLDKANQDFAKAKELEHKP